MERRKLIKQGKGGYTIYLPKKWIDKKGLKEGDEIKIYETNTSLVINSQIKEKKDITIKISQYNENDIKHLMTFSYRNGFDKIILKGEISKYHHKIKEYNSNLLLGFEITKIEANQIILENISEPTEQKYDILLRRIFFIIKDNLNTLKEDYKNNNFVNTNNIQDSKNQVDKFLQFCRRILNKEKDIKNPVTNWELLSNLMKIEHSIFYLYQYISNNKNIKSKKKIENLFETVIEIFDTLYDAYYKRNLKLIHKLLDYRKTFIFDKCIKELELSNGIENIIIADIKEISRTIQLSLSPILSEIIQKNIDL
ncbi:MAG: hypothetical protein KC589_09150 [Nanoarchaeota archaeon]|nr:hypothetical protein [Nanoarchaeota archaeon]